MIGRIYTVIFRTLLGIVGTVIAVSYITWAAWTENFPAPQVRNFLGTFAKLSEAIDPWYLGLHSPGPAIENLYPDRVMPGLVMLTGIGRDKRLFIRVIDREGNAVQEWNPDWFELWPDATGIPPEKRPVTRPGTFIHGAVITSDGDVVFNFEHLATTSLSACGQTNWKLQNSGHHSIRELKDGRLAVSVTTYRDSVHPDYPNIGRPHYEDGFQILSPAGDVLMQASFFDILADSGLAALMYMSSLDNNNTDVDGDLLHLNDVNIYEGPPGGFLAPGDIVASLRNINTVLVIDAETLRVKTHFTGHFLRQHDPEILDGDTLIVFDNNNAAPKTGTGAPRSRLAKVDLASGTVSTVFDGNASVLFFTNIMGKLQLLENGNTLVTSSGQALAFEVSPAGEVIWQFRNKVGEIEGGLLTQAEVLPVEMDADFFARARAACEG